MQQPKQIDLGKRPFLKICYDISYWFQRTFQRKKLFRKVAIHESGHIVFSYFYGFTVRQSRLLINEPGNGFTETVYGKETVAANIIMNNWTTDFQRQNPAGQKHIHRIAFHLMVILYAGSSGEAFLQRKPSDKNYNLQISGEDLLGINAIETFLAMTGFPVDNSIVAKNTFNLYEQYTIFKESILALTDKFLQSNSLSLTQTDIEEILTTTDFFNIRDKIIDANSN